MKAIPTISELQQNFINDLRSKLNLSDNNLKQVVEVFSAVFAGQFKLTYLALSDIQNNIFPDTADLAENGGQLERIGRIYLGRNPTPATIGTFAITVTGGSGSVLRNGLTFKSTDSSRNPGRSYIIDSEFTLASSTGVVNINSLGGGTDFLLDIGDELVITEPVIGVNQTVSVSSVVTQPVAAETTEDYRQNILDSIQLEPQGGSRTDYRLWAADADGVRFVYPFIKDGESGTVQVYVEANAVDSSDGNGTPTSAIISEVTDVINLDPDTTKPLNSRGRRPIQANLEVLSINPTPVDVNISGLNNNSPSITSLIRTNLDQYLLTVRPFVDGADLLANRNDTLFSARIQAEVSNILESSNFFQNLTMQINGVTQTSFQFTRENIPYLRNLTFL